MAVVCRSEVGMDCETRKRKTTLLPDGDTLHELEPLLAGWQGGGPGPEVDQVLLLQRGHLLNHGPQPALEGHQSVVRLARLVVEGGVGDQGGHDNVPNTVVEQPTNDLISTTVPTIIIMLNLNYHHERKF